MRPETQEKRFATELDVDMFLLLHAHGRGGQRLVDVDDRLVAMLPDLNGRIQVLLRSGVKLLKIFLIALAEMTISAKKFDSHR